MSCWDILQIEPTNDIKIIKEAYGNQLKQFHPEEHPEKFQQIKNAYTTAIQQSKYILDEAEDNTFDENHDAEIEEVHENDELFMDAEKYFQGEKPEADEYESSDFGILKDQGPPPHHDTLKSDNNDIFDFIDDELNTARQASSIRNSIEDERINSLLDEKLNELLKLDEILRQEEAEFYEKLARARKKRKKERSSLRQQIDPFYESNSFESEEISAKNRAIINEFNRKKRKIQFEIDEINSKKPSLINKKNPNASYDRAVAIRQMQQVYEQSKNAAKNQTRHRSSQKKWLRTAIITLLSVGIPLTIIFCLNSYLSKRHNSYSYNKPSSYTQYNYSQHTSSQYTYYVAPPSTYEPPLIDLSSYTYSQYSPSSYTYSRYSPSSYTYSQYTPSRYTYSQYTYSYYRPSYKTKFTSWKDTGDQQGTSAVSSVSVNDYINEQYDDTSHK